MKKTTTTGGGCIRSVPTYKSADVIAGADIAGKAQSHGEADETELSERVKPGCARRRRHRRRQNPRA